MPEDLQIINQATYKIIHGKDTKKSGWKVC